MDYVKKRTKKASIAAATILSVCLLFLTIGSFIESTKMMQASAQLPDHSYTPHTGIIHDSRESDSCSNAATEVESSSIFLSVNKQE